MPKLKLKKAAPATPTRASSRNNSSPLKKTNDQEVALVLLTNNSTTVESSSSSTSTTPKINTCDEMVQASRELLVSEASGGNVFHIDVSELERHSENISASAAYEQASSTCHDMANDKFKLTYTSRESWDSLSKEQKIRESKKWKLSFLRHDRKYNYTEIQLRWFNMESIAEMPSDETHLTTQAEITRTSMTKHATYYFNNFIGHVWDVVDKDAENARVALESAKMEAKVQRKADALLKSEALKASSERLTAEKNAKRLLEAEQLAVAAARGNDVISQEAVSEDVGKWCYSSN